MASTEPARAFQADPYDYEEVRRLASELALAEPVAITLVRRGYRTVDAARRFLEAREEHDPLEFDGMEEVCERILSVVRRGGRITIHGDYDVDGVSSTAILVSTLRSLGVECDWLIPDRLTDGYGLTIGSVEKLKRRGSDLLITVDCGIGSVDEVAAARAAGIDVVVTDHHLPGERLPDCPIVHPIVSEYPFEGLCAASVAHKLAIALCDAAGQGAVETVGGRRHPCDRNLDLVALATVADMVPLVGENRRLVRDGLRLLRDSPRVGLRALMAVASVDPETVDAGALGFRLGPRINAAGRLYRADAGVELMLTSDRDRAAQIAEELDRANGERRWAEQKVVEGAERARAALPRSLAEAPALVLTGEGWHPGVVGIAASRLVERHYRPTILLSLDGARAKGSARSIPGFDLVAALGACDRHLARYGGHRAAAGLELEAVEVDAFREAFIAHAAAEIDPADLVRMDRLDALVGVGRDGIGMDLARQLESLGPFGMGNPGPRLLVPSGRLREVRPLGEQGKHSRFQLESGAGRAVGVAFGMNGEISRREDQALDLSIELEVDRWNGAEQPRVVVRELYPLATPAEQDPHITGRAVARPRIPPCGDHCPAPEPEWRERLDHELARVTEGRPGALLDVRPAEATRRVAIDRRGGAAVASLAELISSGETVLAICADAARRAKLASEAADPRRFGAALPRVACCRCGSQGLDAALADAPSAGLVLADWTSIALRPQAPLAFRHVVLIDPPPSEPLEGLAWAAPQPMGVGGSVRSYLHLAWGPAEVDLAERLLDWEWNLRAAIREIWRGLAASGGEASGTDLRSVLAGGSAYPRTPELAARCVRVLSELDLCEWLPTGGGPSLRVLSSERTDLRRSRAYTDCVARHQEAIRFLRSKAQPK
jgi:single-stranded-DNA-specific exonuclease